MKNLIGGAKQAAKLEEAATAPPSAVPPPVGDASGSRQSGLSSETSNPMEVSEF